MADQGRQQRELVFCHACSNEWLRDQHGLQCPECHSDVVEIVSLPGVKPVYLVVRGCDTIHKTFRKLTLPIDRSTSVMIHEITTSTSATTRTMRTMRTRLPLQTMTAYPTMLYITTILGKQKRQIPMSQISSTSNGILPRACISLALPIDHLLQWVEVRPMTPSHLCSKAFPPYLKAQQTQTSTLRADRKRGISGPSSIHLISTVQNLRLRIPFLITSITTFTIIIAQGLPARVRPVGDRRSQQPGGYGLKTVPMHLRTTET